MSIESLYRVRVDFIVPDMREAEEQAFWSGIFNADEASTPESLETCEANMFVSAIFTSVEEAERFNNFLHRYLSDKNANIAH